MWSNLINFFVAYNIVACHYSLMFACAACTNRIVHFTFQNSTVTITWLCLAAVYMMNICECMCHLFYMGQAYGIYMEHVCGLYDPYMSHTCVYIWCNICSIYVAYMTHIFCIYETYKAPYVWLIWHIYATHMSAYMAQCMFPICGLYDTYILHVWHIYATCMFAYRCNACSLYVTYMAHICCMYAYIYGSIYVPYMIIVCLPYAEHILFIYVTYMLHIFTHIRNVPFFVYVSYILYKFHICHRIKHICWHIHDTYILDIYVGQQNIYFLHICNTYCFAYGVSFWR